MRHAPPPPSPPHPTAAALGWALFLDIDGTLVEYARTPDSVALTREAIALVGDLTRALDGAVAILSGRAIPDIDRMTAPLVLPAAGLHGIEQRDARGNVRRQVPEPAVQARMREAVLALGREFPRAVIEDKGPCIALHYRSAPELAKALRLGAEEVVACCRGDYEIQPGVYVFEIKPVGADKGRALVELMREAPFHGRVPIAIGDDHTDEHAFEAANAGGGFGIAVGARNSHGARYALRGPTAVLAWLGALRAAVIKAPVVA